MNFEELVKAVEEEWNNAPIEICNMIVRMLYPRVICNKCEPPTDLQIEDDTDGVFPGDRYLISTVAYGMATLRFSYQNQLKKVQIANGFQRNINHDIFTVVVGYWGEFCFIILDLARCECYNYPILVGSKRPMFTTGVSYFEGALYHCEDNQICEKVTNVILCVE